MADRELVTQIANEFGWTQAAMKLALENSRDEVTTREEVILCMLRYAGPTLKRNNYERGALKRATDHQKKMLAGLIQQLTDVQDFYASKLVPSLRATINEQAAYINDVLKNASRNSQGGDNG
jgi:hypothetical protein